MHCESSHLLSKHVDLYGVTVIIENDQLQPASDLFLIGRMLYSNMLFDPVILDDADSFNCKTRIPVYNLVKGNQVQLLLHKGRSSHDACGGHNRLKSRFDLVYGRVHLKDEGVIVLNRGELLV